jgi:hypothetical protein
LLFENARDVDFYRIFRAAQYRADLAIGFSLGDPE